MKHSRNVAFAWGLVLVGAAALAGTSFGGDEDPRLGGKQGRLRYRISRSPYELVETPDVVTWKDGTRREAYFLEVYGDWLVYYVKETENSWLKEEIPRSQVANVDFLQYLEVDPLQPRVIEPARKQPLPKEDLLAGAFVAEQGRHSRWRLDFTSEIDKVREFSEDAMDHGTFKISSETSRKDASDRPVHEVRGEGNYWLYAPGAVNNKEWVLVLSEIVQREVDRGRETILWTHAVPSETFILHFAPRRDEFQLQWSNLGGWAWGSLVNLRFRKQEAKSGGQGRGAETPKSRALPARSSPGPRKSPAADASPGDWALASAGARWGIEGWKRPRSAWPRSR